jgi:hypothetical protein
VDNIRMMTGVEKYIFWICSLPFYGPRYPSRLLFSVMWFGTNLPIFQYELAAFFFRVER